MGNLLPTRYKTLSGSLKNINPLNIMTLRAFNKPYGVICQFSPDGKHPTLKDFIDLPNVYPAGRLDTDSEGLLLLTDNGKLQHQITHPKRHIAKTYLAQVEGVASFETVQKFAQGIELKEFRTLPAVAKIISEPEWLWQREPPIRYRKSVPDSWLQITISEGKNRQVRRMCAATGLPCLRLVRCQIGALHIQDLHLGLGEWCEVSEKQLWA